MAVPALHDWRKRYSGAHWALQVRLQILRQHQVGVFPILQREGVSSFIKQFKGSDLALSARHVAASLPVYHQVCNLENVVLNLLVETENTNLLPSLLSMMALNSTALTSRG